MSGMTVPTVTIKHRETGETMVLNALDYAKRNIPGTVNISDAEWDLQTETHGDGAAADAEAEAQRELLVKLANEADEKEKAAAEAEKKKAEIDGALANKATTAAKKDA